MTAVLAKDLHSAVKTCVVADCKRPRGRDNRMCFGDPTIGGPIKSKTGAPWLHSQGYLQTHAPKHPLASVDGKVLVHRLVLFEKIGPGTHPCYHCGIPISWTDEFPHGLVGDHLDHNRLNNDPSNLVPSCVRCNCGRGPNRLKTHCPRGHAYDEANTYIDRNGSRVCRACRRVARRTGGAA